MRHTNTKPCGDCGSEDYDVEDTGMTRVFNCADCGAFVKEVVEGPGP